MKKPRSVRWPLQQFELERKGRSHHLPDAFLYGDCARPDQTDVAGTAQVTAANDGGLLSNPIAVTVIDAPLTVTSLNPAQAATGSARLTVTVTGTGFTHGSRVLWNGSELTAKRPRTAVHRRQAAGWGHAGAQGSNTNFILDARPRLV